MGGRKGGRREGSNILRVGAKGTRVEGLSGIWHPIICVYGLLQTPARRGRGNSFETSGGDNGEGGRDGGVEGGAM